MVTWPEYLLVPRPVSMPWYSKIFLPEFASVTTCNSEGVPSSCVPVTTVSHASRGVPDPAQTTLRASPAAAPATFAAAAPASAWPFAAPALSFGLVSTAMSAPVARVTPLLEPSRAVCTTRSPPSTGSPSKVRS